MSDQLDRKKFRLYARAIQVASVFFMVTCGSQILHAQVSAGTVLNVTGNVIAKREVVVRNNEVETKEFLIEEGAAVQSGDIFMASDKARVRYNLADGSTYVLQENSKLGIDQYNYSTPTSNANIAHFQFDAGVMEFVSGNIGKLNEDAFKITTDFVEIGIRGSGAIITTDSNSTQVFVTHGQLTGLGIDGQLVLLQEGETTIFDATGEPKRYFDNITGAEQTMSEDGSDLLYVEENSPEQDSLDEETENTHGIYRSFLAVDPDTQTPSQDQLVRALSSSMNAYPDLYAELITVAIEYGLEPPTAAYVVTNNFGNSGDLTEERVAEIFLASTAGIADPAEVEIAILSVEGAVPVDLSPTGTNDYGQGIQDPIPTVPLDGEAASPAR